MGSIPTKESHRRGRVGVSWTRFSDSSKAAQAERMSFEEHGCTGQQCIPHISLLLSAITTRIRPMIQGDRSTSSPLRLRLPEYQLLRLMGYQYLHLRRDRILASPTPPLRPDRPAHTLAIPIFGTLVGIGRQRIRHHLLHPTPAIQLIIQTLTTTTRPLRSKYPLLQL